MSPSDALSNKLRVMPSDKGGGIDKMVSRLEAAIEVAGLYGSEASKLGAAGLAASGIGPHQAPFLGGVFDSLLGGMPSYVFGATDALGKEIERRNQIESDLYHRKLEDQLKESTKQNFESLRTNTLRGHMDSMWKEVTSSLGSAAAFGMGALKGLNAIDKFAKEQMGKLGEGIGLPNLPGMVKGAGALDVGSAAAYSAAYQQYSPMNEMLKEQKRANDLARDIKRLLEKLTGAEQLTFVKV